LTPPEESSGALETVAGDAARCKMTNGAPVIGHCRFVSVSLVIGTWALGIPW
jgi:hypothetical protein